MNFWCGRFESHDAKSPENIKSTIAHYAIRPIYLHTNIRSASCRSIIRDCVNAGEHDAVIFAGSGCTGAVHLLINSLTLSPVDESPIVIAGPYDHHSTLLPWREIASEVSPVFMC